MLNVENPSVTTLLNSYNLFLLLSDVGYQLKFTKSHSITDSSQVNAFLNSSTLEAILKQETETELTYLLPETETHKFCKFFQNLEIQSFSLGLDSWKLSHVTLSDILK